MDTTELLPDDPFLTILSAGNGVDVIRHDEIDPPTYEALLRDCTLYELGTFRSDRRAVRAARRLAKRSASS